MSTRGNQQSAQDFMAVYPGQGITETRAGIEDVVLEAAEVLEDLDLGRFSQPAPRTGSETAREMGPIVIDLTEAISDGLMNG